MHSSLSGPSPSGRINEDDQQFNSPPGETPQRKDGSLGSPDNQEGGEEGLAEGANKFYCYLCSITCHNQQVGYTGIEIQRHRLATEECSFIEKTKMDNQPFVIGFDS